MSVFFCAATRGFYPGKPYGDATNQPCVEITEAHYRELLNGEALGQVIKADESGAPFLALPPEPLPGDLLKAAQSLRLSAYRSESDPLKIEAEYDAQLVGGAPDYSAWMARVAEIKERFPLPK